MKIGERIKELRLAQGISQVTLAKATGYSNAIIAYWERGEKRPTSDAIIALADYFGVSADYLLGREDEAGTKVYDYQIPPQPKTIHIHGLARDGDRIDFEIPEEEFDEFKRRLEEAAEATRKDLEKGKL